MGDGKGRLTLDTPSWGGSSLKVYLAWVKGSFQGCRTDSKLSWLDNSTFKYLLEGTKGDAGHACYLPVAHTLSLQLHGLSDLLNGD